jgi:DNA polymerase-1
MEELPMEGRTTAKDFWKLNGNHEFAKLVAEYKEMLYLRRNFLDAMPKLVDDSGYLHPSIKPWGTKTGRLAVTDPAMQTIPKHGDNAKAVRKLFLPDAGDLVVDIDYSSLEMYIAHHLTGDEKLLENLLGEWDVHTVLAAFVYGKNPEDVTPEERQSVKPVNFGAGYGISAFKLALDPAMEAATGGDSAKAQEFLDAFWDMYSTWRDVGEEWKAQALNEQYLMTEMGRKRRWNVITADNYNKVKNQAMNFKGQSLASDLCLTSLIKLEKVLPERGWGRVLISVHDSIVFSIHKDKIHEAIPYIIQVMTTPPFETTTPFKVDVSVGYNYGETEPYDSETDYAAM